jgi:glycosyltransferase involved in cell wall biosynthesis
MSDAFHEFFTHYAKGELASAIAQILPAPDVSYDALHSTEHSFPALVNYIDASLNGSLLEAYLANQCLLNALSQNKQHQALYKNALYLLERDQQLLAAAMDKKQLLEDQTLPLEFVQLLLSEHDKQLLSKEQRENILRKTDPASLEFLTKKLELSQGWIAFQKQKPDLAAFCIKSNTHFTPVWYPLRYFIPAPTVSYPPSRLPLLFLEPLECDFEPLLAPLKERPAVFAFETWPAFLQMLQFPAVVEALSAPHHLIYILDIYPQGQFALQNPITPPKEGLAPILFAKRKQIEAALTPLAQALTESLAQARESSDTAEGNWLYQIAKRLLFSIQQARLGINRAAALTEKISHEKWRDPHKDAPPPEKELGPPLQDLLQVKLEQLAQRALPKQNKIRLAHIVPQVVDGGHAPSRLLENLIRHHDQTRFELFVISNERMQFHPFEYPFNFYNSNPSDTRAPKRLNFFRSVGVQVELLSNRLTYEQSAQFIAERLHSIKADIALFHGPDVVNCMTAQLTDAPLRVLFEHGTPPSYPGFDLAIVSSAAAVEIYRELYANLKTAVQALPYHLDVRDQWKPHPYSKEQLGVPKEALVMTTISNHLESRLGHEMCVAIAEILERVPNAYYAPIGVASEDARQKFKTFFSSRKLGERIIFLGAIDSPSQYARSMQLYLNEFPFGSGLGILDAMASGMPVVAMYDLQGPPQARYGGEYFGIERVVASCKRQDYVSLACQLLTNPAMYQEWSEHAIKQYEKKADVPAYVRAFEQILISLLY